MRQEPGYIIPRSITKLQLGNLSLWYKFSTFIRSCLIYFYVFSV
jgi:hypothetical protein